MTKGKPVGHDIAADPTWSIIQTLKAASGVPVIVKGILTAEDAELAVEYGADGIIVSNHGGRQLDTVTPTVGLIILSQMLIQYT